MVFELQNGIGDQLSGTVEGSPAPPIHLVKTHPFLQEGLFGSAQVLPSPAPAQGDHRGVFHQHQTVRGKIRDPFINEPLLP
jgi:hypothetical protein